MLGCGNWTGMALFFVRSVKQQLQVTRFTSAPFVCKRNGWVPKKVEILVWHASLNHILTRCTLARRNISVSSEFCPMMDSEHKSAVISDDVHKLTAYHESGHTPCLFILMGAHTVHKATTVPHAMVFVVVTQLCKKDETRVSRKETLARLDVCMGGRVAEELIFGEDEVTSGASSESAVATSCSTEITIYTECFLGKGNLHRMLMCLQRSYRQCFLCCR